MRIDPSPQPEDDMPSNRANVQSYDGAASTTRPL